MSTCKGDWPTQLTGSYFSRSSLTSETPGDANAVASAARAAMLAASFAANPTEEDVRELSALSFSEPDRQLYVTTHSQREQGAPVPSAFRFDNQNLDDEVFLGFVGYRDFVLRCIRHEYGCEGSGSTVPRVPMCAPGVAGTVNTPQGRMLVMRADANRGREAALSRISYRDLGP